MVMMAMGALGHAAVTLAKQPRIVKQKSAFSARSDHGSTS
jgi:hypothetical protein